MAERNSIKKVSKEALVTGIYRAEFKDGQVVEFDAKSVFPDFDSMSEVAKQFIRYGVKQKLDDSMADVDGDVQLAQEELKSTIEAVLAGKWTTRVAGEGGENGGLMARALAKWKNISLADAKALITQLIETNMAKLPDATEKSVGAAVRKSLLASQPAFAACYAELQVKRPSKKAETPELDLSGV